MGNQVGGVGPAGPSPEEIATLQQQKDQQQQSYLISSELQFMITSLQTMANQLQDRITEAKATSKEEAATGLPVSGAAPSVGPASATGVDPTADLADISACPPSLTTFSKAVLVNPAETDDKAKILLSSTTLDNTVQQLVSLSSTLKSALSSNVSPSALDASLQKILPGAMSAMNQLATTVQNMPDVSPSLKSVADSVKTAGQNLLTALSPPPTTTADLASFSEKLASQVQNPTSALMQTHLTHLQTANQVGGSLGVVMPPGHISGLPVGGAAGGGGVGAVAPKGTTPGSVPGDNPWAAVWQWMFGSNGLMAKVGSKMGELSALLRNQSKAMEDFSKMLGFFASLAKDGISYNFNPSQNHDDKTGWVNFQKAIYAMNKHWPTLDKGLHYLKSLIGDLKALTKAIPSLAYTINKMAGNFYHMCNGFYAMRYMGTYQVLPHAKKHTSKGIGYLHTPGGKGYITYTKVVGKYVEISDAREHTAGGGYMHTAGGGYKLYTKKFTNPIRVTVDVANGVTYMQMKKNPHIPQWVHNVANNTWGKASPSLAKVLSHDGKPLPTGAKMKWSSFMNYQHGAINSFDHAMQSFRLEVKDAGPNIQSVQTGTQSQIKLYLTYYQQIMQTGPSLVQTLNSLAMAVTANLRGGQ